jgi:hypothetical protein
MSNNGNNEKQPFGGFGARKDLLRKKSAKVFFVFLHFAKNARESVFCLSGIVEISLSVFGSLCCFAEAFEDKSFFTVSAILNGRHKNS